MLGLKLLDENMRSCNSGKKQSWKLGKKYRVKGKLVICQNGYHLTFHPERWNGTRVFLLPTRFVCVACTSMRRLFG